jgi:Sec7-like guanine-nucleotide exchange factor
MFTEFRKYTEYYAVNIRILTEIRKLSEHYAVFKFLMYDELLPKLSPAMRKICLSQKAQEEKSKKDEWFSSLQYLNASINDLPISESFLDNGSEFDGFNLATAEELGWKVNKPSKFAVKGNSEHIFEALGWYTNVAVTLKDMEGNPIITIVGNYACVDNGEPEPMLWLGRQEFEKSKVFLIQLKISSA